MNSPEYLSTEVCADDEAEDGLNSKTANKFQDAIHPTENQSTTNKDNDSSLSGLEKFKAWRQKLSEKATQDVEKHESRDSRDSRDERENDNREMKRRRSPVRDDSRDRPTRRESDHRSSRHRSRSRSSSRSRKHHNRR